MTQLRITEVTGATPIQVYVADYYGNNKFLVGTITGPTLTPVPPVVTLFPPSIFNTAPAIMLILVDANGCEKFKILDCTFGCAFNITITQADCVVNIDIQESSCVFNYMTYDPSCAISLAT